VTTPPAFRADFPVFEATAYLNTATMAAGSRRVRAVLDEALDAWQAGRFHWPDAEAAGEDARRSFAALIGAEADCIAVTNAASAAAGIVAAQLPPGTPGENVLVGESEFASNFLPWAGLRGRGYEVRLVPSRDGGFRTEDFARLSDGGTRLIAVSAVQSATGYRADLGALADIAARFGAWLVTDASQAVGAIPIDVVADGIDALFTCNHKFLLGMRGLGYLYVRREHLSQWEPVAPGWRAARDPLGSFYGPDAELSSTASRLDGSLAWFNALADREALRMLEALGWEHVFSRNAELTAHLVQSLRDAGHRVPFTESERGTIVSISVPDAAAVRERLAGAGVEAALRAGQLRIAVHAYNDEADIERLVAALGHGTGAGRTGDR
jgi:selenocysteine lyase/cysteine desulfurase